MITLMDYIGKTDPEYRITGQESTKALVNGRQFQNVKVVYFVTPSGVHDHIEVPEHDYTADNVHMAILAKVHEIERVHSLPHSITNAGG